MIALLSHKSDDPSRNVGKADGRVDLIDILASWSACASELPIEVFVSDFELISLDFRENGHGSGTGVNTTLRFGFWDSLDSMDARFVLECLISAMIPERAIWTA